MIVARRGAEGGFSARGCYTLSRIGVVVLLPAATISRNKERWMQRMQIGPTYNLVGEYSGRGPEGAFWSRIIEC